MKRLHIRKTLALFFMCLCLVGCGAGQIIKKEPVKGTYYVARVTFNDILGAYLGQRELVSASVQVEIDAKFFEASKALDVWGLAISAGEDPRAKELIYDAIKRKLLRMLFEHQVLKIEEVHP